MERNGVGRSKIEFTDAAIDAIIEGYTREAGVRGLEREIGSVCRKVAREFAEGKRRSKRTIRPQTVMTLLGKPRFVPETVRRTGEAGVATGLAWTPVGGDVLFVEATSFPGDGKLQVTGQLGDVMKESAAAALSYVKNARRRRSTATSPRTGSAATTCTCTCRRERSRRTGRARASRWPPRSRRSITGRPVRADTAMTGEITLTGQVLPIGGLKEKALAAQRADIHRLIVPRRNEADIDDVPEHLRKRMKFVLVDDADEVLDAALESPARSKRGRAR